MKTITFVILSALVFLLGMNVQETGAAAESHVVFYVPHQDDDTLTMGVAIRNHINAGHNVHVVMLTDGAASFVRKKMGMTAEDFTEARNKEFELAMVALGVNECNIDYRSFSDGSLQIRQVKSVIREYEAMYPNAKHKAYSYTDTNEDHSDSGEALRQLSSVGEVTDARYYVRRGTAAPKGKTLLTERLYAKDRPAMRNASTAYKTQDTSKGLYGIGYRSVKASFDTFDKLPQSRYHK